MRQVHLTDKPLWAQQAVICVSIPTIWWQKPLPSISVGDSVSIDVLLSVIIPPFAFGPTRSLANGSPVSIIFGGWWCVTRNMTEIVGPVGERHGQMTMYGIEIIGLGLLIPIPAVLMTVGIVGTVTIL